MVVHIGSIGNGQSRYHLTAQVMVNETQRRKELGYYPLPGDRLKREIRERDHYTCQICGKWGNNVDHIVPLRISHDNSRSNLRVLCSKCNLSTRLKKRDARIPSEHWFDYLEKELQLMQLMDAVKKPSLRAILSEVR